jgi:succinoglycan biosynthesis transport protein ExoP
MGIREFIRYIQVLRRRWKPIIGLFLGTMVTLVVLSFLSPRVYRASAQLQVIAPPPGATTLYSGYRTGGWRDEISYAQNTFIEILQGWVVADRTVNATGISIKPEELQERIEVETESDFIQLMVTGDSSEEAAQLTNGLAAEALAYYGELLSKSSGVSREFISAQLELARQELDRAQAALMQFKIENKVGSLDEDIGQQTSLIRSLGRARDDALVNEDVAKANAYDALITRREQELQALLNLSAQYQALESQVAQASSTYNYLLGKEAEAKITENQISNVSFILVVEPANPPRRATSIFSASILVLAGVLSLVLGVAVAFAWEYVDTSDLRQEEPQNDPSLQRQPACVN